MIAKIHNSKNGIVLAVCDSDLLGKRFEENDKQLDLTSDFYSGEEKNDKEIADLMRNAYIVNIIGEKSIALAIKEEIISTGNISHVQGIPHAEAVVEE